MVESGSSRPLQDKRFGPFGSTSQGFSSKNSWPMKSWGMPGAVSRIAFATRLRLRAYQERWLEGSASAGNRGSRPANARSWFSTQVTARQAWSNPGGYSTAAIADIDIAALAPPEAAAT